MVVCSELKLLLKLNKIFENNDLKCSSLVSVKDVFYLYESGQDIIISYPLLCDVHKCSDLEELLLQEHNAVESPEE